MTKSSEKLASSLEVLQKAQRDGVVRSSELSRTHRERLVRNGFLNEVVKGWLIVTNPSLEGGTSTAWYASFWPFVRGYLNERFGDEYSLSAEASIKLYTACTTIPEQLIVITKGKGSQTLSLPFGTSLLIYQDEKNFPEDRVNIDGLWIMELPVALCRVQPVFFRNNPNDSEIALRMAKDPSQLLRILLEEGKSAIAGRLVGAYEFIGEERFSNRILKGMKVAGYSVRPSNPFARNVSALKKGRRIVSPYVARIETMWRSMRGEVVDIFPEEPGMPDDLESYMNQIDEIYLKDAYNSLSIEGYQISYELIMKIRKGEWNVDHDSHDRRHSDAMVAKGYSQAFEAVKESIVKILKGDKPADIADVDLSEWYSRMFSPSVQAGILKPSDLAGYRNEEVYIRNSLHVPPPKAAVIDCMEVFFSLLRDEVSVAVRAVLGHFIFVFIHPYMDGNGRIGRFLMNTMLASGGYPWTVIRIERRSQYLIALEEASVEGKIRKFTEFIKEEMTHWQVKANP